MRFSFYEVRELVVAWIALTLAFTILYAKDTFFSQPATFFTVMGISAIVVGSGFLLHELAHKYLAQKYGCWAEFRADKRMLLLMLLVSFFGFIFAAPGGVYIQGQLTYQKNGKISLVGPAMNLLLAVFFLLLSFFGVTTLLVTYGLTINSWLAVFNLLPFGAFDGAKVFLWNRKVYFTVLALSVAVLLLGGVL